MAARSYTLPFDLEEVYGDHPVRAESFVLDNEAAAKPKQKSLGTG